MKTILFAAALALVGGAAQAQAWNTVLSKDGQKLDFDAASVVQDGEVISFTARTTFEQPMAYVSTDGRTLEGVSVALESFAVDCAARTYTDHGLQYSDAAGGAIAGDSAVGPAKPIGSASASLVGGLIATLCPA